jgi:hypothetical protein
LQAGDHHDRERELSERQHADREPAADGDASISTAPALSLTLSAVNNSSSRSG